MITYTEKKPFHKMLLPYVEKYVQVRGEKWIAKTVPPQLGFSLVFDFKGSASYEGQSIRTVLLGNHRETFRLGTLSADHDKLLIKFTPYGLSAFQKAPLFELNNQFIEAGAVWGSGIEHLYDSLAAAPGFNQRILQMEAFLLERFREPSAGDKMIFKLADAITRRDDLAAFFALKRDIPLSIRQVERNFKKLTGTPISQYLRIARFQKARRLLAETSYGRLTEVAYQAGYYDQSHFIGDFKRLTGTVPKRYQFC